MNNSEDKSCSSPRGKQQQNDSTKAKVKSYKDVTSKKPISKTQAKPQSKEIGSRKTEKESVKSKSKVSENSQDAKHCIGSNEECQDPLANNSEYQNGMKLLSENGHAQNSSLVLNSSTPEIVSYEVAVGV